MVEVPPLLEIQLLRGPTATADGEPVAIPGRLRRRLLWRLAVAGGALVETEDLIAGLWPEDPPRTAAQLVGSHIARLRSQLSGRNLPADLLLPRSDGGYRLDGALTRVDVHALAGRVAACRDAGATPEPDHRTALGRAVADLHRFVPTTDEPGTDSAPWLHDAVDAGWLSVREICRLALAADDDDELDAHRAAVYGAVAALARRWPYDETVAAWQVELLARSGRPAEALWTASSARDRLADDLGVGPSPELTRAHELALTMAPAVPPSADATTIPVAPDPVGVAPPRTLPHPPDPLVGRDADLSRLRRWAARPDRPITISITGAAGVGKSGVALRLADELAPAFPSGQLYLDLHAPHPPGADDTGPDPDAEVAQATSAALTLLGVPPPEQPRRTADLAALLRSLTATNPMLWVFDNVRPQHGLAPLLPTAPGSLAILTSVTVHPDLMSLPRHELAPLAHADADALLVALIDTERARGDRSGRRRIVELCEGRPAAVRAAAARIEELAHLPLTVLADRLADDGHRLEQFSLGSHGVAAALDLSRDGLPETARAVLPALGVVSPAGLIDPDRVAAAVELPRPSVLAALDDLVRAGLLEWDASAPGPRISGLIGRYALGVWESNHTDTETAAARARADAVGRPTRPRLVSGDG